MIDKKFIKHSSKNDKVPFRNGFHFYYILQPAVKQGANLYFPKKYLKVKGSIMKNVLMIITEEPDYGSDVEMFSNDWVEIDVDTGRFLKESTKIAQVFKFNHFL